jgi:hypothetical protein
MGRTHSLAQFQAVATLEIWLRQMETHTSDRKRLAMPEPGQVEAVGEAALDEVTKQE